MAPFGIIIGILASKSGSLELVVKICAALNITGAVIRQMSVFTGNFGYILVGNIFIAVAQFMVMSCLGALSNNWFADYERTISTTIIM